MLGARTQHINNRQLGSEDRFVSSAHLTIGGRPHTRNVEALECVEAAQGFEAADAVRLKLQYLWTRGL